VADCCQQSLARISAQLSSPTAEMTRAALLKEPKRVNTFKKVLSSQGESNEKPPRKAASLLHNLLCAVMFKCGGCSLRIVEEHVSSQHGSWTCWTRFCQQRLGIKEVLHSVRLCQPESRIWLHTQFHSPATVFPS